MNLESPTKKLKPLSELERLCTVNTISKIEHTELNKDGKY